MPKNTPYHNTQGRECSDCKGVCPWNEFYNHPKGFRGKQSYCKTCAKKRVYKRLGRDYDLRAIAFYF